MDESGGVAQQQIPLPNGSSHEAESIVPKIPKAPVDQARRLAARPGREVAPIVQCGGEAAARRVPRDAGADDSPSDVEDVEPSDPNTLKLRRDDARREPRHSDPGTGLDRLGMPPGYGCA